MSSDVDCELARFHHFVAHELEQGHVEFSPEEILDLWRERHPASDEFEDTVADLHEALEDMENGDKGVAFEQFDREFRARHKLPD
jgi:hypothetical protein